MPNFTIKISSSTKIVLVLALVLFTTVIDAQSFPDTTKIQNVLQEEIVSWNKGDAETYSRHFADDGTFTNILGIFFTGHKEFLVRHEEIFKGVFNGTVLQRNIVSLKFVHPDVAIGETQTWISGFSKNGPQRELRRKLN